MMDNKELVSQEKELVLSIINQYRSMNPKLSQYYDDLENELNEMTTLEEVNTMERMVNDWMYQ